FSRDWSSDVCSSDLPAPVQPVGQLSATRHVLKQGKRSQRPSKPLHGSNAVHRECSVGASFVPSTRYPCNRCRVTIGNRTATFDEIGRASCRERVEGG